MTQSRGSYRPAALLVAALLAWLDGGRPAAGQHPTQPFCECLKAAERQAESDRVDRRFRSPRATLRTFLAAVMLAPDVPEKIEEASACLDLSGLTEESRASQSGQLAYGLDMALRSVGVLTTIVPDHAILEEYDIVREPGASRHIVLRRQPDGRWLFDAKTVEDIPIMVREIRKANANAPKAADDVPAAYRTPRATCSTFFQAIRDRNLDAAARCLDLSKVPPPARHALGREAAVKIKEIFNRVALVLMQDVPDTIDGEPVVGLARPEGRIALVRQESGDRKGHWLFAAGSIEDLAELYDALEDEPVVPEVLEMGANARPRWRESPGLRLRGYVPEWGRQRFYFLGLTSFDLYQPFGLVAVAAAAYILGRLTVALGWRSVMKGCSRSRVPLDPDRARACILPIGWLVSVLFLNQAIRWLDLRVQVGGVIFELLAPLTRVIATLVAYRLVELGAAVLFERKASQGVRSGLAAMVLPVVSLVARIGIVLAGLVVVLRLFDLDVAAVLAGLGIGGVAVALAAQDTLKSFFGSLTLIADRTFVVGDLVRIGENEGVVESVGLRSTRIRGGDDSLLTVPNSQLSTMHLVNFGARRYRRYLTTLAVEYGTPTDALMAFRDGILAILRERPTVRQEERQVVIHNLDREAIELQLSLFFIVANRAEELAEREAVNLDIIRLAQSLNLELARPKGPASPGREASKEWIMHSASPAVPAPHAGPTGESPGPAPAAAEAEFRRTIP
ncbi:MAG: mechanosensitive ion channel family protein [Isosphaeraceae bacterium]